jgi:hypothetical protein
MWRRPIKLTVTQLVTKFHHIPPNQISFSLRAEERILTDEATGEREKLVRTFTVNSFKSYAGGSLAVDGATHARHVVPQVPHKAKYTGPPGWG